MSTPAGPRGFLEQVMDRRTWFRVTGTKTFNYLAGIATLWAAVRQEHRWLEEDQKELISILFAATASRGSVAGVPAAHHPIHSLKSVNPKLEFYEIETAVAETYRQCFFGEFSFRTLPDKHPHFRDEDGLALFGSQVSNVHVRELLGRPWEEPRFEITDRKARYKTRLHWNLHTPQDGTIHDLVQYNKPWKSKDHRFVHRDGEAWSSRYDPRQRDDYLLITALPRHPKGHQRVVIFAGLHGAGTGASATLFQEPPKAELKKLLRLTGGEPYYQALFHVNVRAQDDGTVEPRGLRLVNAARLRLTST